MHKVKVTKRQRKLMTGHNSMSKVSLKCGDTYEIAGTEYAGLPKLFNKHGKCIRQGVPFVRVTHKPRYIPNV